jgi:hypothetical protein
MVQISHRAYHLHVSKSRVNRLLRWTVTRSIWGVGSRGESVTLGAGHIEVTVEGGTAHRQALDSFRLALEAYEAEIEARETLSD